MIQMNQISGGTCTQCSQNISCSKFCERNVSALFHTIALQSNEQPSLSFFFWSFLRSLVYCECLLHNFTSFKRDLKWKNKLLDFASQFRWNWKIFFSEEKCSTALWINLDSKLQALRNCSWSKFAFNQRCVIEILTIFV